MLSKGLNPWLLKTRFINPVNILAMSLRKSSRPVLSKLFSAQYSHASRRDNSPKVSTDRPINDDPAFYAKRSEVACLINVFQYPYDRDRPRHVAEKASGRKKPEEKGKSRTK